MFPSGRLRNLLTFNWNVFFRPTHINKFQLLVIIDELRERIMLIVRCQILRNSGREADREMSAIILCDRILVHPANDQPERIRYSMTPNSRKCGEDNQVFQLGRHLERRISLFLSLSCGQSKICIGKSHFFTQKWKPGGIRYILITVPSSLWKSVYL